MARRGQISQPSDDAEPSHALTQAEGRGVRGLGDLCEPTLLDEILMCAKVGLPRGPRLHRLFEQPPGQPALQGGRIGRPEGNRLSLAIHKELHNPSPGGHLGPDFWWKVAHPPQCDLLASRLADILAPETTPHSIDWLPIQPNGQDLPAGVLRVQRPSLRTRPVKEFSLKAYGAQVGGRHHRGTWCKEADASFGSEDCAAGSAPARTDGLDRPARAGRKIGVSPTSAHL